MPVKPLTFKGDKKSKKRKHRSHEEDGGGVESGGQARDSAADPSEDDSWTTPDQVSDLTGPTMIVLPTTPPTCLAADALGNVFASPIENMVEAHAETAEPHDVRQVWVASRVAGASTVYFKGSHGGFLSCDSIGVLGARREARGTEEGFEVELAENTERPRWRLRTMATKMAEGDGGRRFLAAVVGETTTKKRDDDDDEETKKISVSLRGDGEADSPSTHLVIKMQARFKPRVQQNKETKAKEKISRRELEQVVGRRLEDDEVKRLKRARKDGTYYEEILDVRVKGKHDKFAS
jgi:protein FRG1